MSTYFAGLSQKEDQGLGLTDPSTFYQQAYGGVQPPYSGGGIVPSGGTSYAGGTTIAVGDIILPGSKSDEDYMAPEGAKKVPVKGKAGTFGQCFIMYEGLPGEIRRKCPDECGRWWISRWSEGTLSSTWVDVSKPANWGEMPCPSKGAPGVPGAAGAAGPTGYEAAALISAHQVLRPPVGGKNCEFFGGRRGKQIWICDNPRRPNRRKRYMTGLFDLGVQLTVGSGTPEAFDAIRPPSGALIPMPNVAPAPATSPWVWAGIAVLGYMAFKMR